MSRSGYSDYDDDRNSIVMWRGQVASAIRGKRGQTFLREMLEVLDTMPEKQLIADELENNGRVCAIGSVGLKRGIDMQNLDPYDYDILASAFNIAHQLVREIEYVNDECGYQDTPETRWTRVRNWVASQIKEPK